MGPYTMRPAQFMRIFIEGGLASGPRETIKVFSTVADTRESHPFIQIQLQQLFYPCLMCTRAIGEYGVQTQDCDPRAIHT